MPDRLVCVVASSACKGRCRDCRRRVVFVTTASTRKQPARGMAFDWPKPFPTRTEVNDATGITFEYWPTANRHIYSCPMRRREGSSGSSPRRRHA